MCKNNSFTQWQVNIIRCTAIHIILYYIIYNENTSKMCDCRENLERGKSESEEQ